MNSAERIIAKFQGQNALARLLKVRQGTIFYWSRIGTIPAKWHQKIIDLGQAKGVEIHPSDFVEAKSVMITKIRPGIPTAKWPGVLRPFGEESQIPCYVLEDGRRVISRTGATGVLTEGKGGGNLESYINTRAVKKFLPADFLGDLIEFSIPGTTTNKSTQGMQAETFLEICKAYIKALEAGELETDRQREIAAKCAMFVAAVAKVGLIALIDEATGYQFERPLDALQFKLKVFLEEEMRKWEKTFPDELWIQFSRLTNWQGSSINARPKYWGKLVNELVYDYLDPDVAKWLRENVPKPLHRQNYHQWLSSQFGLKKLLEHIWMLIGMASACHSIRDLREKMAEKYGRQAVQYTLFVPYNGFELPFSARPTKKV